MKQLVIDFTRALPNVAAFIYTLTVLSIALTVITICYESLMRGW